MPTNTSETQANSASVHTIPGALIKQNPLIRDADGAFMMGCSKATFWRRVADGTVPAAIKIGGTSRWRLSDIEAVIARAEAARSQAA